MTLHHACSWARDPSRFETSLKAATSSPAAAIPAPAPSPALEPALARVTGQYWRASACDHHWLTAVVHEECPFSIGKDAAERTRSANRRGGASCADVLWRQGRRADGHFRRRGLTPEHCQGAGLGSLRTTKAPRLQPGSSPLDRIDAHCLAAPALLANVGVIAAWVVFAVALLLCPPTGVPPATKYVAHQSRDAGRGRDLPSGGPPTDGPIAGVCRDRRRGDLCRQSPLCL